tara:strand:- start:660 stop:959 length:300 start_codon:yes stop_codon:yes gene_type:complete
MDAVDPKIETLEEACETVRQRGEKYGKPSDHFARTIGAINCLFRSKLKEPLTPADWAMFMVIDKISREQQEHQHDNVLDIIGYGACMSECKQAEGTCRI